MFFSACSAFFEGVGVYFIPFVFSFYGICAFSYDSGTEFVWRGVYSLSFIFIWGRGVFDWCLIY